MSIRKFLISNLLLTFALTIVLMLAGTYYLTQKDIRFHSESTMISLAESYEMTFGEHLLQNKRISSTPVSSTSMSEANYDHALFLNNSSNNHLKREKLAHHFFFQIWDNTSQQLLLHSHEAPVSDFSLKTNGFGRKVVNGKTWHVYTFYSTHYPIRIVLAEEGGAQDDLTRQITWDDILIIAIVFPFSILLTFYVITRALNSLQKITKEVSNRDPSYLEPVNLSKVPKEIQPLIDEVNQLLLRVKQGFEREKRFSADAAHELRTPLAALKTQAQVALRAEDAEVRKLALQHVIEGVDRSTHLVQQLLTLSRLIAQVEVLPDSVPIRLHKVATEVVANMAPQAIEKQIDIELLPEQEEIMVQGNSKALNSLIWNLVDNAIRYTPTGGAISVSIERKENKVILKVCDNGPGIPDEFRGRLFERFFRVLGNDTPGSGLGFAIIEQVAKLHKANVEITTPPLGHGLEVSVIFPVDRGVL